MIAIDTLAVTEIRGHILEYDDATHTYICDGVIVPSVTQLISLKFGSKYDGIPETILNNAARLGNLIHSAIEAYETTGVEQSDGEVATEFDNFLRLKSENGFVVQACELPVVIEYNGEIVAAGRADLIISEGDKTGIGDIKRTSKIDMDSLTYQLSLYAMGCEYSYGITVDFLRLVYLRKEKHKYIEVPRMNDLAIALLETYEESVQ